MTALTVQPAYPVFTDTDGQPLENGYIWVGTANLAPQTNPINVYWDSSLSQSAVQPIRTINGYPSNNGTPGNLYAGGDYSILVQNKNARLVYSAADIASATTVDIGGQSTDFLRVTGTTTITGFGANYTGQKVLIFSGVLTITHNATTLILPGGASITTAAGDSCIVVPKSSVSGTADGWQVVSYQRYAGLYAKSGDNSDITSLLGLTTPVSLLALRSYISGCALSTAGASTTMSIGDGAAMDSTNAFLMQVAATSKTTSAWAVGAAVGGLDTGSIANNTWYHFYIIRRPDTGVVDVVFSLNSTSPTLPTNYTQFRRIGSGKTNGSAQWTKFHQDGDYFQWDIPVNDVSAINPGTAAVLRTLSVPTGVRVQADLAAKSLHTSSGTVLLLSDPAVTDTAPVAASIFTLDSSNFTNGSTSGRVNIFTNTSAQIRSRNSFSDANIVVYLTTIGWRDSRRGGS
jgi:hypothetical protein